MLFALAAAFLFACSGVCAQRSSSLVGPVKANFLRLVFATLVLTLMALVSGSVDLGSTAACRLYLSGLVGFGLGDMALFFAFPRLGARLTLLINLCAAPLFGSVGDYLLLGTRLQPVHALACVLILLGVALALMARSTLATPSARRLPGIVAAIIAGFGQGLGATLSRHAHAAEAAAGFTLPSHVETCLRVVPGMLAIGAFWLGLRWLRPQALPASHDHPVSPRAAGWIIANATVGAILGVTCFQHALSQATSAVVLSITATTPILVMPMTYFSERDRPAPRSIVAAAIAVAGVVMLKVLG
jgi:drug/metabolite transporter (DMT)-like permease